MVGCSAPAHLRAPTPKPQQCAPLTSRGAQDVYGIVTDGVGRPLEGVDVEEMRWTPALGPDWMRVPGATATTAADGTYHLPLSVGHIVVFKSDGRQVVWGHVVAPRRIDVVLDRTKPRGVVALFDARLDEDRCGGWQCPMSHEPVADWWTRPHPCPDGATLRFALSGHYSMGGAGVGVECELDGKRHGPFTSWVVAADRTLDDVSGWFDHGRRCGQWHEPPEPPRPPDRPPSPDGPGRPGSLQRPGSRQP